MTNPIKHAACFLVFLFLLALPDTSSAGECKQFVELHSSADVAREMGASEEWVVANHKIKLWAKTSEQGRFPKAGELLPGSRALLLEASSQDYKVKSPYDGSTGWVNQIQVKRVSYRDDKTFRPCSTK